MTDIEKRNFEILLARISGEAISEIAKAYELSNQQVRNVLKKQEKKIAAYDSGFKRMLGGMQERIEGMESHEGFLEGEIKFLKSELSKSKKLLAKEQSDNKRLKRSLQRMEAKFEECKVEIDILGRQIRSRASRSEANVYVQVKSNIKKFRD